MPESNLILSFPDASPAEAERLARQMATMLHEELPDLKVETARSNPDSQAGENLLILFADGFVHAVKTETAIVAGVAVGKVVFDALVRISGRLLARVNATNSETQQVTPLSSGNATVAGPGQTQGSIDA
ncbi:MAG: hypothetical protein U0992_17545 [Planctomycetaceae bacterium]